MKQYFYSAKAFDVLERLDPCPEYWEGKMSACLGVVESIFAGSESRESLKAVTALLKSSDNPQSEIVLRTLRKLAKELRISI
jgi:intraflagellar transport protein 56